MLAAALLPLALASPASAATRASDPGAPLTPAEVARLSADASKKSIVVLRDQYAIDRVKASNFDLGAQASATMVKSGAAAATRFNDQGVAVFVHPKKGAMLNVSLTGQRVKFTG